MGLRIKRGDKPRSGVFFSFFGCDNLCQSAIIIGGVGMCANRSEAEICAYIHATMMPVKSDTIFFFGAERTERSGESGRAARVVA